MSDLGRLSLLFLPQHHKNSQHFFPNRVHCESRAAQQPHVHLRVSEVTGFFSEGRQNLWIKKGFL